MSAANAAALWQSVLSEYEREMEAYARSAAEYSATCREAEEAAAKGETETFARIIQPAEAKHDAAADKRYDATEKLVQTPAPDAEAMLFKLDVLTAEMEMACAEDAVAVRVLRDDAHRLFKVA